MQKTPYIESSHDEGHELRMGLLEHLAELRDRLLRSMIALVIGTIIGFGVAGPVYDFLRQPYCQIVTTAEQCQLVVLGPTGTVVAYFRVSLLIGGILAIPMMTYQLMAFVIPALTHKEKRYILLSLPAITLLFLVGISFAWLILIPPALQFLEGFQADLFRPEWTADAYFGFVTALIFWMGVAFEAPLVFFVLGLLGLVQAKTMLTNWRIAVVGSAVVAAIITPTIDPVNMFLVMGPLMGLYVLSVVLVFIARRLARLN